MAKTKYILMFTDTMNLEQDCRIYDSLKEAQTDMGRGLNSYLEIHTDSNLAVENTFCGEDKAFLKFSDGYKSYYYMWKIQREDL